MSTTSNPKRVLGTSLIVIGILSIVLMAVCFLWEPDFTNGSTEKDKSYGGDAYTDIQNGVAQIANNTYLLNTNLEETVFCIKTGFACILLVAGLTIGSVGLYQSGRSTDNRQAPVAAAAENASIREDEIPEL